MSLKSIHIVNLRFDLICDTVANLLLTFGEVGLAENTTRRMTEEANHTATKGWRSTAQTLTVRQEIPQYTNYLRWFRSGEGVTTSAEEFQSVAVFYSCRFRRWALLSRILIFFLPLLSPLGLGSRCAWADGDVCIMAICFCEEADADGIYWVSLEARRG